MSADEPTLTALVEQRAWAAVVAATDAHLDQLDAACTVLRARALIHSGRVDDALASLSRAPVAADEHVAYWRDVCFTALGQHAAIAPADAAARTVGRVGSSLVKLVAAFLSGDLSDARTALRVVESWPVSVARETADPLKPHWVFFELIRAALRSLPEALSRDASDAPRLFVLGDSHVISQAHRELRCGADDVRRRLEPMLICSLEAWHLSHRCRATAQRTSAERQVARIGESDVVVVVCGEIDTRMGAGIDRATKSGHYADEATAIRATASDYVDWLAANVRGRCFVQAVRPPRLIARVGRCQNVGERIARFNQAVADRVRELQSPKLTFLPAHFGGADGFLDAQFFVATDTFHMNERCIEAVQAALNSVW
jgi:hypothetical protein